MRILVGEAYTSGDVQAAAIDADGYFAFVNEQWRACDRYRCATQALPPAFGGYRWEASSTVLVVRVTRFCPWMVQCAWPAAQTKILGICMKGLQDGLLTILLGLCDHVKHHTTLHLFLFCWSGASQV